MITKIKPASMAPKLKKFLIILAVVYFSIAAYGRFYHMLPWHDDTVSVSLSLSILGFTIPVLSGHDHTVSYEPNSK